MNAWVVVEGSFHCSERPGDIVGVFSSEDKAHTAAKDARHGAVVIPVTVDQYIPDKKPIYDH